MPWIYLPDGTIPCSLYLDYCPCKDNRFIQIYFDPSDFVRGIASDPFIWICSFISVLPDTKAEFRQSFMHLIKNKIIPLYVDNI